jgi:hypothetical protein
MQLNDAHIFCRADQVAAEVGAVLDLIGAAYDVPGISAHRYRLSPRGHSNRYVADPAMWTSPSTPSPKSSTSAAYDAASGKGAFFGPKIDVQALDRPGGSPPCPPSRSITTNRPRAFNTPSWSTTASSAASKRFVAHLTEVPAGAFPAWLAPVVVLPVTDGRILPTRRIRAALPRGGPARRGFRTRPGAPSAPESKPTASCHTTLSSALEKPSAAQCPCVCASAATSARYPPSRHCAASPPPPPNAATTCRP